MAAISGALARSAANPAKATSSNAPGLDQLVPGCSRPSSVPVSAGERSKTGPRGRTNMPSPTETSTSPMALRIFKASRKDERPMEKRVMSSRSRAACRPTGAPLGRSSFTRRCTISWVRLVRGIGWRWQRANHSTSTVRWSRCFMMGFQRRIRSETSAAVKQTVEAFSIAADRAKRCDPHRGKVRRAFRFVSVP